VRTRRGTELTLVGTFGCKAECGLSSTRLAIGSDPSNELIIDEPTVSRRHAQIIHQAGVCQIRDLGSTNGTFVNGQRVDAAVPIAAGDEIWLGKVRFYVRAETPAQSSNRRFQHTAVVVAALVLTLAAASYQFIRNWAKLLDAADASNGQQTPPVAIPLPLNPKPPRVTTEIKSTPVSVPSVAAPAPSSAATAASSPTSWLVLLNHYRELAHLDSVVEDPILSRADRLHAQYLVRNFAEAIRSGSSIGAEAHREDSQRPNYTDEGARAAMDSLVDWWETPSRTGEERTEDLAYLFHPPSESTAPEWSVDGWLSVPFHRSLILNPLLRSVGYGMYCASGVCAASLDAIHGASVVVLPGRPLEKPIVFPPDGAQVTLRGFYSEWPDPRSSCSGYNPPSGFPLTIQVGNFVSAKLQDFSIQRTDGKDPTVEACGFDETTYSNPDPGQQSRGRQTLHSFGMVVVIPRKPLEAAANYHVTMRVNEQKYDWSFSTLKASGPEPSH
jgi:hypothetical protein